MVIVHYGTRTWCVPVYYTLIPFASFGGQNLFTWCCFFVRSPILLVDVFEVLKLNWRVSKHPSINLVSQEFYDQYLSWSHFGEVKSPMMTLGGFIGVTGRKVRSENTYAPHFKHTIPGLETQKKSLLKDGSQNSLEMAKTVEHTINEISMKYQPKTVFSNRFRHTPSPFRACFGSTSTISDKREKGEKVLFDKD